MQALIPSRPQIQLNFTSRRTILSKHLMRVPLELDKLKASDFRNPCSKFLFHSPRHVLLDLAPCVPPLRFRPNAPFAPVPVDFNGTPYDVSSPPAPQPPPPPRATGGYPTATRTENPEQVLSPYKPFNVMDVAGFASGKLVRNPSNQKISGCPEKFEGGSWLRRMSKFRLVVRDSDCYLSRVCHLSS